MVARDGVTNESEFLALKESEKGGGIKPGKVAALWFPSPVHKVGVLPPVFETVLGVWYGGAAPIGVGRAFLVRNPMTLEQVTPLITLMGFDEGSGVIIVLMKLFGNCGGKGERREEDEDAENEGDTGTTKQQGSESSHVGDEASLRIFTEGG